MLMQRLEESESEEDGDRVEQMVVGSSGVTIRIKHSVKVRVNRELEGYPSVIKEMAPEVIV